MQILRRIYIPVQTEEGWRIRNNDELEKLMRREGIVKIHESTEVKMVGAFNRMERTKKVKGITEWSPVAMRSRDVQKLDVKMKCQMI
jgi:hypothetical protein